MRKDDEYRLLVLDLDGTLTNSHKEITPYTLSVLMDAQQHGLRIVLASGRPVAGIEPLARQLRLAEHDGYILAYNGGQIVRCADGAVVAETVLAPVTYPYIVGEARRCGFDVVTYDAGDLISEHPDNKYVAYEAFLNKMTCRQVSNVLTAIRQPEPKFLIVGDPEPLHRLEKEMYRVLTADGSAAPSGDGAVSPVLSFLSGKASVYRSEAFFLEVVPPGVDKARCLAVLLDRLGLRPAQMIACGDGYNDLSMLQYAGLGVAMANAKPEVKAAADYVTRSNEEDGVAYVVERFFLFSGMR